MPVTTIEWADDGVRMIDQTRLPNELVHLQITDIPTLCEAIRSLRVRGAPALGVAAAFGVLLAAERTSDSDRDGYFRALSDAIATIRQTRPTAVNLGWALDRMTEVIDRHRDGSIADIRRALKSEAMRLYEDDRRINRTLSEHGAAVIPDTANIITHCNTGALATVDYGTALGVVFSAHANGKKLHVWVDETRPLLQGARLNMWELMQENIEATLICDNMAAFVMQKNPIDLCIVGADRIARNGDTANKIGTYGLAVAARHHNVPFYVAAPLSTVDISLASGAEIPIEEREPGEIVAGFGRRTAPDGSQTYSPAFDITPNDLVAGIITEAGVVRPPYDVHLPQLIKNA